MKDEVVYLIAKEINIVRNECAELFWYELF